MAKSTTIVAFDRHAATTVAAVLVPGQPSPALHSLTSDSPTILRFVQRLRAAPVHCCYEAGPCGFELQRALVAQAIPCDVIAPALIPRRPGDRVKTDRRDAAQLAILYRAGALTPIHIPTEQEEAARDLLRCREDIRADLLRARHRLSKFLLRHGRRFTATKRAWTQRHAAWLQAQRWPLPALEQTHRAYVRAVEAAIGRLQSVDAELRDLLTIEPLRSRVARLRCFRGIDDLTALTIAAELGDARRFPSAPRVMAFAGLVPSEHSSGATRARGGITKPAMPTCAACSSSRRGTTGIIRFSDARSACGSRARPRTPSTRLGTRSIACTGDTGAWRRAARRSSTWSPPWRASSPVSSGPC